jgi:hypothetical protein
MTTKADFTDEEWTRLERAPLVAGMAISIADPGGPIEGLKETMAAVKTVVETSRSPGHTELVEDVAKSVEEKARQRQNPLAGFKPKGALAGAEILEELRTVNSILTARATPEEADEYREWLRTAAKRAAEAAKEGGFMGFHAERVSEGEQRMLEELDGVLAAPGT